MPYFHNGPLWLCVPVFTCTVSEWWFIDSLVCAGHHKQREGQQPAKNSLSRPRNCQVVGQWQSPLGETQASGSTKQEAPPILGKREGKEGSVEGFLEVALKLWGEVSQIKGELGFVRPRRLREHGSRQDEGCWGCEVWGRCSPRGYGFSTTNGSLAVAWGRETSEIKSGKSG